MTTSSGARCVVVINAAESSSFPKMKDTASGDGVLLGNKDVFLPQIDDNGDDDMETGFEFHPLSCITCGLQYSFNLLNNS